MRKLSERVLILNKNWVPTATATVRKALTLLYSDGGRVICPKTYESFDFEGWVKRSSLEPPSETDINAPQFRLMKPELMILSNYSGVLRRRVRLSRKNLLRRDNWTCQYCAKPVTPSIASVDHVIPRCRGGRTTWDNCVVACVKCNVKKGNRRPEEVGLRLMKNPVRPAWSPMDEVDGHIPESWKKFLTK